MEMWKSRFAHGSWVLVACSAMLAGCPSPDPSNDAAADAAVGDVASDTIAMDAVDSTVPNDGSDTPADVIDTGSDGPIAGDEDGDRHASMAAGGDDCDDSDANRYPGNAEVCDSSGHDEDCDASTFGTRDGDGDSYADNQCCNTDLGGTLHCGTDCNDANASVHPAQVDVCNGIDDNCDALVDEGVAQAFYVDADGDGYGDPASAPRYACTPPDGYVTNNTDCDDTHAGANPGSPEICDPAMVDENCNGTANEGC
jgi:hypothetical protein